MAVTAACTSQVAQSSPTIEAGTPSPTVAPLPCASVDLLSPAGNRINLTGAWEGATGSYRMSQIGSCVWWVAQSAWPGNAIGQDWQMAFRGQVATDFTLRGDWAFVYIANYSGLPSGGVVYQIEFSGSGSAEQISLHKVSLFGPPFPELVEHLDYPAETLDRVP
jgi:hypothetical protein